MAPRVLVKPLLVPFASRLNRNGRSTRRSRWRNRRCSYSAAGRARASMSWRAGLWRRPQRRRIRQATPTRSRSSKRQPQNQRKTEGALPEALTIQPRFKVGRSGRVTNAVGCRQDRDGC